MFAQLYGLERCAITTAHATFAAGVVYLIQAAHMTGTGEGEDASAALQGMTQCLDAMKVRRLLTSVEDPPGRGMLTVIDGCHIFGL